MKDQQHPIITAAEQLNRGLVRHTRFRDAMERLLQLITFQTDVRIVLIIGPTGVGKTNLQEEVAREVLKSTAAQLEKDRGRIPFVRFEVPCVRVGNFHWPSFYQEYLDHLAVPALPTKVDVESAQNLERHAPIENRVLNALRHRRPLVAMLDEANHFAQVASAKLLDHQMNLLKSLANRSGVLHVLFGTYDLARMMNVTGQLARRTEVIHFSRYRAEDPADVKTFSAVVRTFAKGVPFDPHLDLEKHMRFFHERTLGCIGTLKAWLSKSLAHTHRANRRSITLADLQETAHPIRKLQAMLKEAVEGEAQFREEPKDLDLFRQDFGLIDAKEETKNANASGNKHVGERKPHRDPTGSAFDFERRLAS